MESWQAYFKLLEQLGGTLEQLTSLAQEKTAAVRRNDPHAVDECMKREQVVSLSLRSMEQRRMKLLKDLGAEGIPLSGLVEHCPKELRLQARDAAEKLRNQYDVYQTASGVARSTLECHLHLIEKYLAGTPEEAGGPGGRTDIRA